ncbi:MAG: bacterial transcriptional activator domain-containing protein, partial [Anaerolineae bacterium]|nr:bacterial transcriptional activator domain-containing protein [Anaerolineae bacterium]
RTDLRRTLSLVNSALGGDAVIADRETVQLSPDLALTSDVDAFHRALATCEAHGHPATEPCAECIPLLEEAAALYQDDFMRGFTLEDSAAFDEWQFFQTQALRDAAAGALTRLVQWYAKVSQSDCDQAIGYARRWLALDPLQEAAHRTLMVLYARTGQRSAALRQYNECVRLFEDELGATPAPETAALYVRIREGELVETFPAIGKLAPAPRPGTCPFKGLEAFDVEDADLFFGREALTDRLVRHVTRSEPLLAVVGASGSGKSSLVRAGLVAQLRRDDTSRGWDVRVLTPTADPLGALARAVLGNDAPAGTVADCVAAMLADGHTLDRLCRGGIPAPDGPDESDPDAAHCGMQRLLVVDQFEELFTLCREPARRRAFVDNVLAAADTAGTHVVIALRADFYHRCGEYEGLREALEAHQVYVGAMTTDELRRAIEAPAETGGWAFEPGLVDLLLHDIGVGDRRSPEPGALPLLSHALLETWKHRQGAMLTLKGYADAGGVRGAIAQSAESVYRALSRGEQAVARGLFLRLTGLGGTDDEAGAVPYTRRRAAVTEVLQGREDRPVVWTVLDTLSRARLVTIEQDAVQVAHEALIREWPTLRGWLDEDREGLRIHRHLTETALAWKGQDRDAGELYRGARLAQAREWSVGNPDLLNELEREFLEASEAEAARAEREREAQRQRELEAAQQVAEAEKRRSEERGRLLRWIGVAAALLLVAAVAAAVLGAQYRTTSRENAALAYVNATTAAQNASIAATAQAAEAEAVAARKQEERQRAAAEAAEDEAATQRDAAQLQARINLATSLASEAILQGEKTSELSLLLALEANRLRDVPQTRNALLSALEQSPGRVRYL